MRFAALALLLAGCLSEAPDGLTRTPAAATTVKMDFLHRPLPEIPLPNDVATRRDSSAATGRRIDASMVADTGLERRARALLGQLDGWGVQQPITIPFTGPLDVGTIVDLEGRPRLHSDPRYDFRDDVVYLVDIDPRSPEFGALKALDVGNGNYPVVLEDQDYGKNDPRGGSLSLVFEEGDEDLDGDGELDPGEDLDGDGRIDPGEDANDDGFLDPPEDTDADGVLDRPNYLPGLSPRAADLQGRADALMTFYELETNTLILKPVVPLRERTTYAVVVTKRIRDLEGRPVGSPFPFPHHATQTAALARLPEVLPEGLPLADVAFAFTFTTQSLQSHWVAVREGLYGEGVQGHLGRDFPAEASAVLPLLDEGANPHLLPAEVWRGPFEQVAVQLLGLDPASEQWARLSEANRYVDYYAIWAFRSPQLFPREGADGERLPLDLQSWPPDLDLERAPAREETVYVYMAVPRREVSARGEGQPAPTVLLGHDYGQSRFDLALNAGFFAEHGLATLAIDCVSHGLELEEEAEEQARALLEGAGLGPFFDAASKGRALDWNADGRVDSGADFWTAHLFHTRDVVRQCALDHMQLVRILRGFDGERRWAFDLDGDGATELAGDFDADGEVDVGGEAHLRMTGRGLGGMVSTLVGALEPHVSAIAPVAGGGGLSDLFARSQQEGVRAGVILQVMGPVYTATFDRESGRTTVETWVPDGRGRAGRILAVLDAPKRGDTLVVENLDNGRVDCGYLNEFGQARVAVASDAGDRTVLRFYPGPKLVVGSTTCELMDGAEPVAVLGVFGQPVEFQGRTYEAGAPLVALAEGRGEARATPGLRRFLGLGQMVLDAGDPATYARHLLREPLRYPTLDEETGAHTLLVTSVGDMDVPASGGLAVARAAGIIEYMEDDPRFDSPPNQVLIDTFVAEAVNTLRRFTSPDNQGVHLDVENFSEGTDPFEGFIPRIEEGLRYGLDSTDPLGGKSAALFPISSPTGAHGFQSPGEMIDQGRQFCAARCIMDAGEEGMVDLENPCGCNDETYFDLGRFMTHLIGRYLVTEGQELETLPCHATGDCGDRLEAPEAR